jgi:anti-sigma regulatory factor (Ser/Thr protein kinase)
LGRDRAPLEIDVPATCECLSLVHEATRRAAIAEGFDPSAAEEIAVAVGEAMTNVVEHAYHGKPGHAVRLRFLPGPDTLRIELEHRGAAPTNLPAGVDLGRLARERRRGGLGVHLMRRLMDHVVHEESATGVGCWVLERNRPRSSSPGSGS